MSSIEDRINDDILESGVEVKAPITPEHADVLTPGALRFVAALAREFADTRDDLLRRREMRRREIEDGIYPDFVAASHHIRTAEWSVAVPPPDLTNRTVEIVGPADRDNLITALTSGANVFVADFEDTVSPTWSNVLEGQRHLTDAINGSIIYTDAKGKEHRLDARNTAIAVRPRGWHLEERHVVVDGRAVPAALFDFGVYFYNNARTLTAFGSAPYFYLPKLEGRLEARLWNDVFNMAQDALGMSPGTTRATILIETVPGVFEMDEMLFELRHHATGLGCGRWDYLLSFIKVFHRDRKFVLPDRHRINMDRHFLSSFVDLMIGTAHRRGCHAIGGMSTEVPIESDPLAHAAAMHSFREDKMREVKAGHDGTWVTDAELVPVAHSVWSAYTEAPNQIRRHREAVHVTASDLLVAPAGEITERGLRENINIGIIYLESWLRGRGCITVYNRIETTATTEVARAQIWQWIRHGASLHDGRPVTRELVREIIAEELQRKREGLGERRYALRKYDLAAAVLDLLVSGVDLEEAMTVVAYKHLE